MLIVSGGVFRLWQRSRDEDAAQAEKQRALDELLDPSHFTRKLRDAEFQKGIDDALKRIPLPDALRTGPEVHLASPTEGEVLTASPAHVEGEFVLAKPTDVLSVNGAAARTGSGKFSVDVALTPGENTIEIAVTWGVHVDRASIHVKYSPPR